MIFAKYLVENYAEKRYIDVIKIVCVCLFMSEPEFVLLLDIKAYVKYNCV